MPSSMPALVDPTESTGVVWGRPVAIVKLWSDAATAVSRVGFTCSLSGGGTQRASHPLAPIPPMETSLRPRRRTRSSSLAESRRKTRSLRWVSA